MEKEIFQLEKEYNSNVDTGLTNEQVLINREKFGKNCLKEKKKHLYILNFYNNSKIH